MHDLLTYCMFTQILSNDRKSMKQYSSPKQCFDLSFNSRTWCEGRQWTWEKQEKSTADPLQWRPGENTNTQI